MISSCHCFLKQLWKPLFSNFRQIRSLPPAKTKAFTYFLHRNVCFLKRNYIQSTTHKIPIIGWPISWSAVCQKNASKLFTLNTYRHFSKNATYYEILCVKENATSAEIRAGFLKQSKEFHPDLHKSGQDYHKKIICINEAYSVLSKPSSRSEYDRSLRAQSQSDQYKGAKHATNEHGLHRAPSGQYYDKQFYSMRDKSQDAYHDGKPYYGVGGLEKGRFSNAQIVIFAMMWMVVGGSMLIAAVYFQSIRTSRFLDQRDDMIRDVLKEKGFFKDNVKNKIKEGLNIVQKED